LGQVTTVSAIGAADEGRDLSNLVVQLAGEQTRDARWSIGPATKQAEVRVSVIGSQRQRTLVLSPDLTRVISDSQATSDLPAQSDEAARAEQFMVQVLRTVRGNEIWTGIAWPEVCQTLEISDAVERSIQRRRTIELFHEQVTEAETFKSVMAAGGCALLMWVLALLMIAGLSDGLQLPIRDTILGKIWLFALCAPLAVFLLLQLLQLVFVRPTSQPQESSHAT
ncbi:MAG: hypothetical protein KDB23_21485, partial [Planctomycetales bacterium]|nr:hypothetical protein [Planctomycetales bacterium]